MKTKELPKGESETLELKSSLSQVNEIVEAASAMANTRGGRILVGISDSVKILGVKIGKDTIERLTHKIVDNTDPKVYPAISMEDVDGSRIIIIGVKEAVNKPVLAFGRAFKRVGKSTLKMTRDEFERTILEKRKVYFDEQVCEGAELSDIADEKVRWFLKEARRERGLKIPGNVPVDEALMRLKLTVFGKPTNAAVLLFGRDPQKFFTQCEVRCARFKGIEPIKPFTDMKVFGGNIIDQVDRTLGFVLDHVPLSAWLVPGQAAREERYEYPPDAIREAIVNAVCHRDYESSANVQIRIFDDRIEVWNPGRLPRGWTVETLKQKHESIPRNKLVAEQFFLINFIEKWGTGTNEMIKGCLDWGLPEPEFEFTGTSLVVTFRKAVLTDEFLSELGLNDRQIEIVKHLREHEFVTSSGYEKMFNVTGRQARLDLSRLVSLGLILKKGRARLIRYKLNPEISGNIRKLEGGKSR
jgi:ATP-dependent DNA helicase RecG